MVVGLCILVCLLSLEMSLVNYIFLLKITHLGIREMDNLVEFVPQVWTLV